MSDRFPSDPPPLRVIRSYPPSRPPGAKEEHKGPLLGKKLLLVVTGSIAAYKAPMLLRLLRKAGAEVQVVLTRSGHPIRRARHLRRPIRPTLPHRNVGAVRRRRAPRPTSPAGGSGPCRPSYSRFHRPPRLRPRRRSRDGYPSFRHLPGAARPSDAPRTCGDTPRPSVTWPP